MFPELVDVECPLYLEFYASFRVPEIGIRSWPELGGFFTTALTFDVTFCYDAQFSLSTDGTAPCPLEPSASMELSPHHGVTPRK